MEEGRRFRTHVIIINFRSREVKTQLVGVARGGILDMTKDGQQGIDGQLQVYNLQTSPHPDTRLKLSMEQPFARLTHDGKYAIWVDDLTLKVTRLKDSFLVGNLSTHERPTCVELFDFGYLIVVGREDGHILTMKLVEEDGGPILTSQYSGDEGGQAAPRNVHVRARRLLERPVCRPERVRTFDPLYQQWPQLTRDSHLPEASVEVQNILSERARVVHTIIRTTSLTNLAMCGTGEERQRRSSSPLAGLFESRKSRENSPHPKPKEKNSPTLRQKLQNKKCFSLHDLMFTGTSKAIHKSGVLLLSLTDVKAGDEKPKTQSLPRSHRHLLLPKVGFPLSRGEGTMRDRTPSI